MEAETPFIFTTANYVLLRPIYAKNANEIFFLFIHS